MTPARRQAVAVFLAACGASGAAYKLKPQHRLVDKIGMLDLEVAVPRAFQEWSELSQQTAGIVNPEQEALLRRLYTATLARTFSSTVDGYRIMLSVAYGADQRDSLQVHYPEVCYPSQGFELKARQTGELSTSAGTLPVTRLVMALGPQRPEPLTYWVTVGDRVVTSTMQKKMVEMKYSLLAGLVPDGLLIRVSSIDADSSVAFGRQDRFLADLLRAMSDDSRARFGAGPALRGVG
jgi:EpsI family protein